MPPKKAGGKGKKTANGYRMPEHLDPGTKLTDITKKDWVLGQSIGKGGFGEIYLATEGGKGEARVVKIEPHENGPLFVEMHFYMRAGKPDHLAEYNKGLKGTQDQPLLPLLRGHGSHKLREGDNYRFLVIDRLGSDLDKVFRNGAAPLSLAQACSVAAQVVTTLQYIHSTGHTHNDVKAANLLFGPEANSSKVYLVDFGLCVKYITERGHKEYKPDPKKAHDGTIEYLSRDAHIGCTSRRSDLEVLAFNLIHWLRGTLPWISVSADPKKVQAAKESFVKDLKANVADLPKPVQEFVTYAVNLKFEDTPDYEKLKGLFKAEIKKAGKNLSFTDCKSPAVKKGGGVGKSSPVKNSPAPKRGRKATKAPVAADDSEDSEDSTKSAPAKASRKAPKAKRKEEVSSEDDIESSPVPAKKSKKAAKVTVNGASKVKGKEGQMKGTQVDSLSEDEDMFASTPSPKKRAKVQETGVQTSPAFVAAAKAARVGKKALAQSEYIHGGAGQKLTPSVFRSTKKTAPTTGGTPNKKASSKNTSDEGSSKVLTDISNPTPAMLAILKKKQQVGFSNFSFDACLRFCTISFKAEEEKATSKKRRKVQ